MRSTRSDVHFEVRQLAHLDFTAAFDFVVSTEVVEHLYDVLTFVANCSRAMKPGGISIMSTP